MCYCSGDTPARPACLLHFFLDSPPLLVNVLVYFNPFSARVLGGVCKMTLTFESVNEILWCDHSNESSPPVLSHGAMCFSKFYKMKLANLVEIFLWLHLAVKGLSFLHYVHDAFGVKISKIKLSLVFLLLFDPEASNLALLFIYYSFSPFTGVAMDPSDHGLPVGFDRNGFISASTAVTSVWWSREHVAFYNAGSLDLPQTLRPVAGWLYQEYESPIAISWLDPIFYSAGVRQIKRIDHWVILSSTLFASIGSR